MIVTVHRGTEAIGGSCIEVQSQSGERLLLDIGRPLDAPRDATGLLPQSLDLSSPASVLISHPHMDHWGLFKDLPPAWDIYTGAKSAELIKLTGALFGDVATRPLKTWTSRAGAFAVGSFTVTPFLTDHSALDAYMLLIESDGRRLLYTGDFRDHGRKGSLVRAFMRHPPCDIDVLVMEGTNLRTSKPVISESALEQQFVDLAARTKRHLFVQWSAQNIDRTVTLYRAALRSGRMLVLDLYSADVLERVADGTNLPRPGPDFAALQVVITPAVKRMYERCGQSDFVRRMAKSAFGTSRKRVALERSIVMLRDSMLHDFEQGGLPITNEDCYVFSNWSGYLNADDPKSGWARAQSVGAPTVKLHTSGHAAPDLLEAFAAAVKPAAVIPVHGIAWDDPGIVLPGLVRLKDGERWPVPKGERPG